MLTNPLRERSLLGVSGSHTEHGQNAVRIIGSQFVAIQRQKEFDGNKRSTFVAIRKGMVARNAKPISSRQVRNIGRPVVRELLRSGNGRFQCVRVPQTR